MIIDLTWTQYAYAEYLYYIFLVYEGLAIVAMTAVSYQSAQRGVIAGNDLFTGTLQWRHNQISSLTSVNSTVYSGADQRKYQCSASLAFVKGIHQWLVNSLHKGPVTRKMFPFYDVIKENPETV